MLYFTCSMISCVDLACYVVSRAKVLVSVDCGTIMSIGLKLICTPSYCPSFSSKGDNFCDFRFAAPDNVDFQKGYTNFC